MQIVSGNHEEDTGGDGRIANFGRCLPDRMSSTGRYGAEYFFDIPSLARVIMISPDLTIDGRHYFYGKDNDHYRWLAAMIEDARAKGITWVVVGMHKNCLSTGVYYCRIYQELLNLLIDRKVDLVLQAHEHSYQRTRQIAHSTRCPIVRIDDFDRACVRSSDSGSRYARGQGTVFVINGAGGRELYKIDPKDPEAGYFQTWMGANVTPRNGFTKITLTRRRLAARFVGSSSTSAFTDAFAIEARSRVRQLSAR